ncbi:hypothetical protein CDL12_18245 [Handroanthus impetiginosus]|uniref:Zinc finger GRF-type domain-containing protein n=1 Tax=Handroanthus impetiginosus TaxID=429701 RepID=A0A2G9GV68_9LAMI|nr:hypothetical protein CDL12_18245 [Handroanthus impetiginosus]
MSYLSKTRVTDCYCGKIVILKTSWTNDNPGQRFRVCPNIGGGRAIIAGLLRKQKACDEKIASLKKRLRVMAAVIVLLGLSLLF